MYAKLESPRHNKSNVQNIADILPANYALLHTGDVDEKRGNKLV